MKNIKKKIKHLFLLTGLTAACIYTINKLIDTASGIKNLLSERKGDFFQWRYGSIFYQKFGKGSPILLIHDLHPASSSMEWSQMIKKLEKNYTVYAVDLLGCGNSEKPNMTYTNYLYVQFITDFIRKIIGEKTDIIATGDSCSFCLMAANMNDDIINRLFFISPPSLTSMQKNPNRQTNFIKTLLEFPILGTFLYNLCMTEKGISDLFEKEYYKKKSFISGKLKDFYYESAHEAHSNGRFLLGSIIGNYTNINIIPALKKIKNSIFLIGSRELESSRNQIDSYTQYNETVENAYISNCKRLPQLEEPDKLYQMICMFLEG